MQTQNEPVTLDPNMYTDTTTTRDYLLDRGFPSTSGSSCSIMQLVNLCVAIP